MDLGTLRLGRSGNINFRSGTSTWVRTLPSVLFSFVLDRLKLFVSCHTINLSFVLDEIKGSVQFLFEKYSIVLLTRNLCYFVKKEYASSLKYPHLLIDYDFSNFKKKHSLNTAVNNVNAITFTNCPYAFLGV